MSKTNQEMVHDLYLDCDESDLKGLCEKHNIVYESVEKIAHTHQVGGIHYQNKTSTLVLKSPKIGTFRGPYNIILSVTPHLKSTNMATVSTDIYKTSL
jgi:hypothetical protein